MKLLITILFIILSINSIKSQIDSDYDYSTDQYSNETNSANSTEIGKDLEEDDQYDDYDDEEECTPEEMFDEVLKIILPDDYEENKKKPMKENLKSINETIAIFKRIQEWGQNVTKKLEPISKKIMPRMTEVLLSLELSPECMASLYRISGAAREYQFWAMKFVDSQPSLPSGLLTLSYLQFGEYDSCIGIKSEDDVEADKPIIYGRYCRMSPNIPLPKRSDYTPGEPLDPKLYKTLKGYIDTDDEDNAPFFNNPVVKTHIIVDNESISIDPNSIDGLLELYEKNAEINFRFVLQGLCIPSTCQPKEIERAINKMMYPFIGLPFDVDEDCDDKIKPYVYSNWELTAIGVYAGLLVVSTICTIIELLGKSFVITKAFSIYSIWESIFNAYETELGTKLGFIDGLRALLSLWVFVVFNYMAWSSNIFVNKSMMMNLPWKMMFDVEYVVFRILYLPHVFILISGTLMCFKALEKLDENRGKFSYFEFIVYKYLRLVIPLFGAMLLWFMFQMMGDGPIWKNLMNLYSTGCNNNWNASLLMISNYDFDYPNRMICNCHTWFTSTLFQLILIAPILFLTLYYSPKSGIMLNIIVVITGIFTQIAPKLLFNIPHFHEYTKFKSIETVINSIQHHYTGTEQYLGIFSIGILVGYFIKRNPKQYFGGAWGEKLIWIITWSMTVWGLLWQRKYFSTEYVIGENEVLLFGGLQKYCFIAGFAWLIYACSTGRGGIIYDILDWEGFKFFSKISHEIYLVHLLPVFFRMFTARESLRVSDFYMITVMPYDFIVTLLLSVVLKTLFTDPFGSLVKWYFTPKSKSKEFDVNNNEQKNGINIIEKNEVESKEFNEKAVEIQNQINKGFTIGDENDTKL